MTRMQTVAMVLALSLAVPVAVAADCPASSAYARFNVKTADTYETCTSVVSSPYYVANVAISVTTLPASKVRFSLPDPPFGTVLGEQWWLPYTGNRISGMEFDLGCTAPQAEVVLGYFQILVTGTLPCTTWRVDDGCEVLDCNGVPRIAESGNSTFSTNTDCVYCFQQCKYFPPYNLNPPLGATNVALNAPLSFDWVFGPIVTDPRSSVAASISIGTDMNCGNWQTLVVDRATRSIVLDFLQPGTAYYWTASWYDQYTACSPYGARSQVHSFTTAPVLAVEPTTWGRVKAMYRD